jgi:hypothetical protein
MRACVSAAYFHMLVLQLFLGLLCVSWGLVTLRFHPVLTAVIYTLLCVLFLGLKVVAVSMSDPFGDDAVDFPIEDMLESSFENAVAVLKDTWTPHSASPDATEWCSTFDLELVASQAQESFNYRRSSCAGGGTSPGGIMGARLQRQRTVSSITGLPPPTSV